MARLDLPIVVPWIRLDRDVAAEEALALRLAAEPFVAGFCLFGGEAEGVARLTARLRHAAGGKTLFVASDMERGAGQQVKGLRVLPDAGVFGLGGAPDDARAFGRITAIDARSVGVDVLFAPVVDVRSEVANPIVGNRSFGYDPDRTTALASAYVAGALEGGALPTAKHYPGHGGTLADSHDAVPVVAEPARRIEERDLRPFLDVVAAGCPAVMTAHVAYPSLDPTGAIATFSRPIVDRLFPSSRGRTDVCVFTDALLMAGALGAGGETEAARRALRAGCHALLIPTDPDRLAAELLDVPDRGFADAAARAAESVARLAKRAALAPADRANAAADDAAVRRVAGRALDAAGGASLRRLARGARIVVIDDDATADRGLPLLGRARAAGVEATIVRLGRDAVERPATGRGAFDGIVVCSSVRAWKGAADLSRAGEDLLASLCAASPAADVVRLTPRAGARGVHVPGGGPDVEHAIADRWFGPVA